MTHLEFMFRVRELLVRGRNRVTINAASGVVAHQENWSDPWEGRPTPVECITEVMGMNRRRLKRSVCALPALAGELSVASAALTGVGAPLAKLMDVNSAELAKEAFDLCQLAEIRAMDYLIAKHISLYGLEG